MAFDLREHANHVDHRSEYVVRTNWSSAERFYSVSLSVNLSEFFESNQMPSSRR